MFSSAPAISLPHYVPPPTTTRFGNSTMNFRASRPSIRLQTIQNSELQAPMPLRQRVTTAQLKMRDPCRIMLKSAAVGIASVAGCEC